MNMLLIFLSCRTLASRSADVCCDLSCLFEPSIQVDLLVALLMFTRLLSVMLAAVCTHLLRRVTHPWTGVLGFEFNCTPGLLEAGLLLIPDSDRPGAW